MNRRVFLILFAIAIPLAGCTSLFRYGVSNPQVEVSLDSTSVADASDEPASMQEPPEPDQLLSSQQELIREHERLIQQLDQLSHKHASAVERLNEVTDRLCHLCADVATDSDSQQQPQSWHQRLIEQNLSAYEKIGGMLGSLTEDNFPTVRTWYGETWHQLVAPFMASQFPSEDQRDALVELLDEIMDGERRRVAAMEGQEAAVSHSTVPLGYCLGPKWEDLSKNLRELKY
jgi:hypothetical protein